ncbi:MAG: mechanosensitive ion channel family protein [Haloarculaceae archaeon]
MVYERSLAALASQLGEFAVSLVLFAVVAAIVYVPAHYLLVPGMRRVLDAAGAEATVERPFLKVLDAAFVVLALFVATVSSGFATNLTATATITAAVTLALGFAAQDLLGNFVSGVFIVLDPEFHIGDWIRWNDQEGIVEDIGFRVTRVHTFDNELVTVPNSELTAAAVTNPAAKDRLRITCEFGIGYGDDIDRARSILLEVAADNPEILDRPGATVRVAELAESVVLLRCRFWIAQPVRTDFLRIRSEYVQRVKERFDAAGIEMPYPTRSLTGDVGVRDAPDRPR